MGTGDQELEAIRDELAGLRARVDAVHDQQPIWRRAVGRVRAARRLTVVGIAALMLAVPVAVSAVHDFTDVPTSNTFHTTISRLVGAGITGGCGSGKYCPNSAVTRGQMAAFLNRGLGRAAQDIGVTEDDDWATILPGGTAVIAVTDLLSGGGAGGTGHALVTGNLTPYTDEAGICPCEVIMYLISEVGEISAPAVAVFGGGTSPGEVGFGASVSMSHLFTVPSGELVGYGIIAQVTPTLTPSPEFMAEAFFSLQATYVPFDALGENPDLPVVTAGENLPFGTWPWGND